VNSMVKNKLTCVFYPDKECPVRKTFAKAIQIKSELDKIIKPLGDKELLTQVMPILDKVQSLLTEEFAVLYNYCSVCPLIEHTEE